MITFTFVNIIGGKYYIKIIFSSSVEENFDIFFCRTANYSLVHFKYSINSLTPSNALGVTYP
jgi:hypothetical protein